MVWYLQIVSKKTLTKKWPPLPTISVYSTQFIALFQSQAQTWHSATGCFNPLYLFFAPRHNHQPQFSIQANFSIVQRRRAPIMRLSYFHILNHSSRSPLLLTHCGASLLLFPTPWRALSTSYANHTYPLQKKSFVLLCAQSKGTQEHTIQTQIMLWFVQRSCCRRRWIVLCLEWTSKPQRKTNNRPTLWPLSPDTFATFVKCRPFFVILRTTQFETEWRLL